MPSLFRPLALASAVAALGLASAAQAMTFAQYGASDSTANFSWNQSMTGGSVAAGPTTAVEFEFLTTALGALGDLPAIFTLSGASASAATSTSGVLVQPGIDGGSFSFTYAGSTPIVWKGHTYTTGANLLSGTFENAAIGGASGAQSGVFLDDSLAMGTVTFTSDFLKFSDKANQGFSVALTSILPALHLSGSYLANFTSVTNGGFYADLLGGGGGGGVPEPAAWALMILGMGAVGGSFRVRRLQTAAS